MARREREFGELRQSFMTPKPAAQPKTPHQKLDTASHASQASGKGLSQQGSSGQSRRNREFQQQAKDSRVKRSEYVPKVITTNAPESPTKKLQDVCVNCVNKFMANKHKMKELEKKEQERMEEKRKLEAEREAILQEQMDHIRRVRQEQQSLLKLQNQKLKAKDAQNRAKEEVAKKLELEKKIAEEEEQSMLRAENQRKGKFYQQLTAQIEENKMRKTQQIKKDKQAATTFFDQQQVLAMQQRRANDYRSELLDQIREKQIKTKEQKLKTLREEKQRIEELQAVEYEPNIRVNTANPYNQIKKQIQQREKYRKQQEIQSKIREEEDGRRFKEHQNEISKTIIEQKMKEMSKYVNELTQQMKEKQQRQEKQLKQRRAPAYTPIQQQQVDFKNCSNCDLKFPKNYLSTVEL